MTSTRLEQTNAGSTHWPLCDEIHRECAANTRADLEARIAEQAATIARLEVRGDWWKRMTRKMWQRRNRVRANMIEAWDATNEAWTKADARVEQAEARATAAEQALAGLIGRYRAVAEYVKGSSGEMYDAVANEIEAALGSSTPTQAPEACAGCARCGHSRHLDHDCVRCTCAVNSVDVAPSEPGREEG